MLSAVVENNFFSHFSNAITVTAELGSTIYTVRYTQYVKKCRHYIMGSKVSDELRNVRLNGGLFCVLSCPVALKNCATVAQNSSLYCNVTVLNRPVRFPLEIRTKLFVCFVLDFSSLGIKNGFQTRFRFDPFRTVYAYMGCFQGHTGRVPGDTLFFTFYGIAL